MASWSAADLGTLASSDELLVAPVRAGGVTFAPVAGPINSTIDAACGKRYGRSPYLGSVVGVDSHAVTIAIAPRSETGQMASGANPTSITNACPLICMPWHEPNQNGG